MLCGGHNLHPPPPQKQVTTKLQGDDTSIFHLFWGLSFPNCSLQVEKNLRARNPIIKSDKITAIDADCIAHQPYGHQAFNFDIPTCILTSFNLSGFFTCLINDVLIDDLQFSN